MRRIALALLLVVSAFALTACTSWDWSDPFHPRTGNLPTNYEP